MKPLLIVMVCIVGMIASCENGKSSKKEPDSLDGKPISVWKDSVMKKIEANANESVLQGDTANIASAPVQVLSAKIVETEGSRYRNISLRYKNVSTKKITAIKFKWYGLDAFGEPADMGHSFNGGFGGGYTDDAINPGKTDSGEWEILSRDAKKVVKAWVTEVVFADGSKWKNR